MLSGFACWACSCSAYALLVVAIYAPIGPGAAWRQVAGLRPASAVALAAAFLIAYAIMIAAWPWAGLAPLNPLRALSAFAEFHYPINTILDGQVYRMADVPRWYVPTYIGIKLTLPLLAGACLALVLAIFPRHPVNAANQRAAEGRRCSSRLPRSSR